MTSVAASCCELSLFYQNSVYTSCGRIRTSGKFSFVRKPEPQRPDATHDRAAIMNTFRRLVPLCSLHQRAGTRETTTMGLTSMGSVVAQCLDAANRERGSNRFARIAPELLRRFGKGDNPPARLALYRRIQVCCERWGSPALWHLQDVCDYAGKCECPDRAFCKAITQRFQSLGYFSAR